MRTFCHLPTSETLSNTDESDDCDSEGIEENWVRSGYVDVLRKYVVLDDDEATIVVVFPRGQGFGGGPQAVHPDALVRKPWKEASKIFLWDGALKTGFQDFPREDPVPQEVYQKAVRNKVVDTMLCMGLKLHSFESIDGDETYLKITAEPDGKVLRHLAHCSRYKMPLTKEAYFEMKQKFAGFPARKPPRNDEGHEVYAYTEYTKHVHDKFQPFRNVDMIRLVSHLMLQHLSLTELRRQKVISRMFPVAKHVEVEDLKWKWVMAKKCVFGRTSVDDDLIRDYFGEEVAFFFRFFAFYIRMLVWLALFALVEGMIDNNIIHVSLANKSYCKLMYGVGLVVWAAVVEVLFGEKEARSRQRWGMHTNITSADGLLPDYCMELEGTWKLFFQKMFSNGCVVAACVAFSFAWGQISFKYKKSKEALYTSLLIRACSIVWAYVVPWLSRFQNHRTQRRKNKAMIAQLAVVKLFLYLSPFLRTAFLVNWTNMTCAPTLEEAAHKAFKDTGWPSGVNASLYHEWLPEYVVPEKVDCMSVNVWVTPPNQTCIWGCQPARCILDEKGPGSAHCMTGCYDTLRASLDSVYITHFGFSLLFLSIAIVYAHCKASAEMKKPTQDGKEYTWLQFQAKCDEVTRYEYLSWGGSYVEDFLEVVLGFALISCFGIIRPTITPVVLVMQIVEYRLLSYRMTHVTARPYPAGSTGIDMWSRIIGLVTMLSALINGALAAFVLPSFTRWPADHKIILFFVYSQFMLGCRFLVKAMSRRTPADVSRVEDFNLECLSKVLREQVPLDVSGLEPCSAEGIDVGLHAPVGTPEVATSFRRSFSILGRL